LPNLVSLVTLSFAGTLGTAVVAGMGIANVVFAMLLALLFGFDTATQAAVARATGARDADAAGQALSDALAGSAAVGALLAAFVFVEGPKLVALLLPEPHAAAAGAALLHGLAPSVFLLSLTIPVNSYWIGTGATRIPFFVQLALAPVQIAATFACVFGFGALPALGALGAGLASTLAAASGFVLQAMLVKLRHVRLARPGLRGVASIIAIGWPVSVQQSFLQFGLMLAYAIVAQLGITATAMLNVLASLMMVPLQWASGMGTALATLVGQALGRGDNRDAMRWGWQMSGAALLLFAVPGLFAVIAPARVLTLFLHDAATVAAAELPVRMLGAVVALDAFAHVIGFGLRGAGATKSATGIPFVAQWVLQLPLTWLIGVKLGLGMNGIVAVQAVMVIAQAAVFAWVWRRGRWADVRIAGVVAHDATAVVEMPQRVVVLGGAGAGKSTLARAIGAKLGLPVFHLDRFVFGPQWSRRDASAVHADVAAALSGDAWVVDGTYPALFDVTVVRADLVLWLEQPWWRRLWRAWRKARNHRGKPRADRPDGCEEGFGLSSVWTVLRFGRWSRATGQRLQATTRGRVLPLKGDRASSRWLATLSR
jgi:putative MATE family efflux protein